MPIYTPSIRISSSPVQNPKKKTESPPTDVSAPGRTTSADPPQPTPLRHVSRAGAHIAAAAPARPSPREAPVAHLLRRLAPAPRRPSSSRPATRGTGAAARRRRLPAPRAAALPSAGGRRLAARWSPPHRRPLLRPARRSKASPASASSGESSNSGRRTSVSASVNSAPIWISDPKF